MAKLTPEELNELISVYVGYFNRAPDPKGLQNYVDKLEAEPPTTDIATIANNFANSPEALGQYPYLATPGLSSTTAFITSIYKNLFNREPDADGLAYWEDKLDSGVRTPGEMILAIIKGAVGGDDKAIIDNKIAAALDFVTDAANTPGFVYDDAAHQAAKDTLSNITADPASVTDAEAATDAFLNGASGVVYNLTVGADNFTGQAGNDTFEALPNNDIGFNATTFSINDKLDGGDGTDTLNIYMERGENDGFPSGASVENIEIINIFDTDGGYGEDSDFGPIDASDFVGATQIWQIGAESEVSNLESSTAAGFRDLTVSGEDDEGINVGAAAGAESMTIVFDNVSGAGEYGERASVNADGAALNALNMSGTLVSKDDDADPFVALSIRAGTDVESFALNTVFDTIIDEIGTPEASDLDLVTLDASASTGGITADVWGLTTILTGSGDDFVKLKNEDAETSTVSTGLGDDTIDMNKSSGAKSVDAGEGDDLIKTGKSNFDADDAIDGGEGADALQVRLSDLDRLNDTLNIMSTAVTNVETLINKGEGVTFDVSRLDQAFETLEFVNVSGDTTLTGVTTESIVSKGNSALSVTSDGYDTDPDDSTGDLNIKVIGDASSGDDYVNIAAFAENLNLTVETGSEGGDAGNTVVILRTNSLSEVADVQTATVDLISHAGDVAVVSTNAESIADGTPSHENMTSFTVTGNGIAVVENENNSSLETTDASGLASTFAVDTTVVSGDLDDLSIGGLRGIYEGDFSAGDASFGLIYQSDNNEVTETVTLSDGIDIVTLDGDAYSSTVANTDVITGLNLVTDAQGELTNASDFLSVNYDGSAGTFNKLTTQQVTDAADFAGNDLGDYLDYLSNLSGAEALVFHLNGDTFVYRDFDSGAGDAQDEDGLVQLTGTLDLNDLLASLNYTI